jgi:hypothetical protein
MLAIQQATTSIKCTLSLIQPMTIAKDVDNKSIIVVLMFANYVKLDFLFSSHLVHHLLLQIASTQLYESISLDKKS